MAIERFELDAEQWAVVPRVPSVTNEMKARFIGEFSWSESRESEEGDEPDVIEHTVPWWVCKEIFHRMTRHWIAAAPRPEAGHPTNSVYMCPDHGSGVYVGLPSYPAGCCFVCGKRHEAVQSDDVADHAAMREAKHRMITSQGWDRGQGTAFADGWTQCAYHYGIRSHCKIAATAPRPVPTAVPTSERLPVHIDADYSGLILAFTRFTKEWVLQAWTHVHNCPNAYTHWQPTGLVRPAEPDGGAV